MSSWKTVALVAVGFNVGVVYTTACSDKSPMDAAADDDTDGDADDTDGDDPPGDTDGGGLAELASQVTELASQVTELATSLAASEVALASLQTSVDCYIGHQTDDVRWYADAIKGDYYPGRWHDIGWDTSHDGDFEWMQGPNSDAAMAYVDCF